MARSYKFALIRLSSGDTRDERLNIGLVVFREHGADVRLASRLDKVRAISAALDPADIRALVSGYADLDRRLIDAGMRDFRDRMNFLGQSGPATLSSAGEFQARNSDDYEARITSILQALVEPEPAPKAVKIKRSRLLTQVKSKLRSERVLAVKGEDLESHRIVPNLELENGLVADLALRNGSMHVIETVDASGGVDALRKAISDIGVSALVLDRARMEFGEQKTKTKLVYAASPALERAALPSLQVAEHQGAELINWASVDQQAAFLSRISSLATPVPDKRRREVRAAMAGGGLF